MTYTKADELGIRLLMLNTGISREDALVMWAGPELLQVLKDAEFYANHQERACRSEDGLCVCMCGYYDWWTRFNAAIAKAEGKE